MYRGQTAEAKALRRMPLLTLEGENDLIAAPGQTSAALRMIPGLKSVLRRTEVIPDTGHFGLFYGESWRNVAAPIVLKFLDEVDARADKAHGRRRAAP